MRKRLKASAIRRLIFSRSTKKDENRSFNFNRNESEVIPLFNIPEQGTTHFPSTPHHFNTQNLQYPKPLKKLPISLYSPIPRFLTLYMNNGCRQPRASGKTDAATWPIAEVNGRRLAR